MVYVSYYNYTLILLSTTFRCTTNEKKLYKESQLDFTHALREDEFIPTLGKSEEEIIFFVSYSRKDKKDVELLISELEKTPYPFIFWKDEQNLISGENFKGNIQEAIEECDFGLLMVSENFESQFIVEHELPHFLEMRSSEISKTKVSIPLFINHKNNAIKKLSYINDETLIFSYEDRSFMELHDRKKFIGGLVSEIFKKVKKQQISYKSTIENLQNIDEVSEVDENFISTKAKLGIDDENFIPTKTKLGIDVVKEIKEWSKVVVKDSYTQMLKIERKPGLIRLREEERKLVQIKENIRKYNQDLIIFLETLKKIKWSYRIKKITLRDFNYGGD
ncbi:MAG: Unknown protein [uncultured Sulfurovum sp.]|uniref:TIR domain-containing protein n=1 Tax=uncultured Sulfurovum sp. TaxID=269237 RepID=A0A6S6U6I6_9BACT|nr:MAG: Unknown protein [uncultured Sulfurovum sp.]